MHFILLKILSRIVLFGIKLNQIDELGGNSYVIAFIAQDTTISFIKTM